MASVEFEPVATGHVERIQALIERDPAILANTRAPDPYPADGAQRFVARLHPDRERAWAMFDTDGEMVGVCGVILHHDEAEIGYWVGADHRGRGFASAGARRAVQEAAALGYTSVRAETRAGNVGSRRVLEKVGFELVCIRRNGDRESKWPPDEPMADYRLRITAT